MKFIYVMLCVFCSSMCFADQDPKKAKVEELLNLTSASASIEMMVDQVEAMMQKMSDNMQVKKSEQPVFDKHLARMETLIKSEMSWEKIKQPILQVYYDNFTIEELEGMIAFYQTPAGKATIEKMPQVMQSSIEISQQMVREVMPKMQAISEDLMAELQTMRQGSSAVQ